jgi:Plasma-membrane choline transporter
MQWAYVYVGLYGYGFVEASINVLNLFKSRGWTAIIADTLVDTVLMMFSFGVGLLTGLVGLIVAASMQQGGATMAGAFFVGMLIGLVFCSTLFGLISSGVNAVIVLFAESPAEFAANHPQLSQEMLKTWREAYPVDFMY